MSLPDHQRFAGARRDIPRLYGMGCIGGTQTSKLQECTFGAVSPSNTVVLFGDSHAAQWFPALETVAIENHWRLVTLLRMACPAADVTEFDPRLRTEIRSCGSWREAAFERIRALQPTAVIIGNTLPHAILPDQGGDPSPSAYEEWRKGTRRTLLILASTGTRTILLRDSPDAQTDVIACLARAAWRGSGTCSAARSKALNAELFQAEKEAAEGLDRVSLVDLSDEICGAAVCEPMRNAVIVYQDRTHLTATFAKSLAAAVASRVVPFISGQ